MRQWLWIGFVSSILLATQVAAQSSIPAGTILPVQLNSSLNSRKIRAGQGISARVMENVPLAGGSKIRAGAKLKGQVLEVKNNAHDARVSIRFDEVVVGKHSLPVTTNLRALASMMAVSEAHVPVTGPDRGTSEEEWTVEKVGGESTIPDLLMRASAKAGSKCRGEVGGEPPMQSLWVFSSDACGAYGFSDLEIVHAGRTAPVGEITLASRRNEVNVRAGSGMLLRVD
jgi:hypothetical protein